jgi:hypothetical protein
MDWETGKIVWQHQEYKAMSSSTIAGPRANLVTTARKSWVPITISAARR